MEYFNSFNTFPKYVTGLVVRPLPEGCTCPYSKSEVTFLLIPESLRYPRLFFTKQIIYVLVIDAILNAFKKTKVQENMDVLPGS